MRQARLWLILVPALALLLRAAPAGAQAAGAPKSYAAGWNLIALPAGTTPLPAPLLYTLQPGDLNYERVDPAQGATAGFGYWANVPASGAGGYSRSITLGAGSSAPYSILIPAGQWVMVGDPSGILPATVQGADIAVTYDPLLGYLILKSLQPGQGAFVISAAGALVTVTPASPAPQAQPAAPSPQPASAPAAQSQPQPWVLPATPLQTNPVTAAFPTGNWTWWPQPPVILPYASWLPSLPYSGPFVCPSDIVTAFALIYCGALSYGPP